MCAQRNDINSNSKSIDGDVCQFAERIITYNNNNSQIEIEIEIQDAGC